MPKCLIENEGSLAALGLWMHRISVTGWVNREADLKELAPNSPPGKLASGDEEIPVREAEDPGLVSALPRRVAV